MIFIAMLIVPLCVMNLATYKVSYKYRDIAQGNREKVEGYEASDRHFQKSQLASDSL